MRYLPAAMAACALAAAGCGSVSTAATGTSATAAAPASKPGGPFKVTAAHCGPLTPAQQNRFDTSAKAGLIVKITDTGSAVPLLPQITADFLNGSTVDTENYSNDYGPHLVKGQSEQLEIDNITDGGSAGNPADSCKVISYEAFTASGQNAGTWPVGSAGTLGPSATR